MFRENSHFNVPLMSTYSQEELEFLKAVDRYKREHQLIFPNYTEILKIAKSLGYRKVEEPTEIPFFKGEKN